MTLLLLLILPGLLVAGVIYQMIGSRIDERQFPPPGRLVDLGAFKLHIKQQGSGQPAVVLEAGIAATSISWSLVQARVAEFTTVCSYDRAGLGWSERRWNERHRTRSRSCTLEQMIAELDALLCKSGLAAPFVLVGHSFGGLLVNAFAHAYPEQVAGLVLVDPVSLTYWSSGSQTNTDQIRAGARLSRRGAILARIGVVRAALSALNAGRRWFPISVGWAVARQGSGSMQNLAKEVAKLPRGLHSRCVPIGVARKGFWLWLNTSKLCRLALQPG